jgi:thiol-disulfide isomerase/thioredoxin
MNRQNIIFVSLLAVIAIAILVTGYVNGIGPLSVLSQGISRVTSGGQMIPSGKITEETKAPTAPELSTGLWINSEPLTRQSLRGRVVLIEFWTFACYNCRNTLPIVKKWDAQYRDKGLTIIGVHTPELDYESNIDNLRREVCRARHQVSGRYGQRLLDVEGVWRGSVADSVSAGQARTRALDARRRRPV